MQRTVDSHHHFRFDSVVDFEEIGSDRTSESAHAIYAALVAQWQPAMLETASSLGLFGALRAGPLSVEEIAAATGTNTRAVKVLLDALVAYGWVTSIPDGENSRYSADPAVAASLSPDSIFSLTGKIGYNRGLSRSAWRTLDQSVRDGVSAADGIGNNEITAHAYEDLVTGINFWAPPIVDKLIDWTTRTGWRREQSRKFLDVGCGSGVYSQLLLRHFSHAVAVGLDVESIGRLAVGQSVELGVDDRFRLRAANFWRDDWGTGHDAVLFANIFHLVNPAGALELLDKARDAVADDGFVFIVDNIAVGGTESDSPQDRFAALFAVSMLVTGGGSTYTLADYDQWLSTTGLERVALIDAPMHRIVVARRTEEGHS